MAADSSKFPAWFITFVLLSICASVSFSSVQRINGSQECVDGVYEHDGRLCCLCGAGLHLEEHCTINLQHGKCKSCDPETYSSQPNNQESCEPCTSCSQPNANLEVDEPCTRARDAKCRCKKGHYCSTDTCRICYPCEECGAEGIKVPCTAKINTVCNDKIKGGNNKKTIIGATVPVVVIIGLGLFGLFLWKKRRDRKSQQTPGQLTNGSATDVEMQPLRVPDVDLQPHLYDIAGVIGWKDMQDVAMRSSIPIPVIESCQLDHPGSSQQQTVQLLMIWIQKKGRKASSNLIQILEESDKKDTAERVMKILSKPNLPA